MTHTETSLPLTETSVEYAARQVRLAEMERDRLWGLVEDMHYDLPAQRRRAEENVSRWWGVYGAATRLQNALASA